MAALTGGITDLGQVNQTGAADALFLKIFAGDVLAVYDEMNVGLDNTDFRPAPRGAKSTQYIGLGRAHTARREIGANILSDNTSATNDTPSQEGSGGTFLSAINIGEREVFIDDPLLAGSFVDKWQEFKSQFNAPPALSREHGERLSVDNDKLLLRLIVKGASGATTTGFIDWSGTNLPSEFVQVPGGTNPIEDDDTFATDAGLMNVIDVNADTDGSALLDSIRKLAEQWDTNDVPENGRHFVLPPAQYNLLVQNQDLLNRDFGGANGIFSQGTVFFAWGVMLHKSNHVPTGDTSGDGTLGIRGVNYNIDAQNTVGVGWQEGAVASTRAGGISMQKQFLIQYQGTVLLSQMATGYDILRPLGIGRVGTSAN